MPAQGSSNCSLQMHMPELASQDHVQHAYLRSVNINDNYLVLILILSLLHARSGLTLS